LFQHVEWIKAGPPADVTNLICDMEQSIAEANKLIEQMGNGEK
jgi:hypothetical protein